MLQFPDLLLRGTVRVGRRGTRQKMVDGMMGYDALFMAIEGLTYVGVLTDDDDLIPALLSAHVRNPTVLAWVRARAVGSAINDSALLNRGLRICSLRVDQ